MNILVFYIRSAGIRSRGKNPLASMQSSTELFVFPKELTGLACQSPLTVTLYNSRTASAYKNFSMGLMLRSISKATVGVQGKADEIIRQASFCTFVSFLTRYFLLRPSAQNAHACSMIGCIIAVYIHFILDVFILHVLPTICLHCINAVVALRVIRVICGFQVSLLSRVTPNMLATLESLSFEPFIDKEPKSGFCLRVNSTISVCLPLNCSACSEAQFAAIFITFWPYLRSKVFQHQ